jgi:hypothetical protein
VLVLRTYLLSESTELPYREGYGGCKSWIELEEAVSIEGSSPAMDDEEFERVISPTLKILEEQEPAPVGS